MKTIEYRFYEAINENKEHDEPSVSEASRRRQATIFSEGQGIPPPQPTLRTEKDIGSENPETTAVSGFCYAIFQGGIQKISFSKNDLWRGPELKHIAVGTYF